MNRLSFRSPLGRLLPLLALTIFSLSQPRCTRAATPTTQSAQRSLNTITIANIPRTYILHLPPTYDGKTKTPLIPLVMLLHGANDTAEYAEEAYHFVEKSHAENFALVIPESTPPRNGWDAFSPEPDADSNFLTTLITTLPKTYALDPARIYIAGHSSGACMTYRLAADRGNLIAAAAIVAGSVGRDSPPSLTPKTPVPLIIFHGKQDPIMPYEELPLVLTLWTKTNTCNPLPKTETIQLGVTPRILFSIVPRWRRNRRLHPHHRQPHVARRQTHARQRPTSPPGNLRHRFNVDLLQISPQVTRAS